MNTTVDFATLRIRIAEARELLAVMEKLLDEVQEFRNAPSRRCAECAGTNLEWIQDDFSTGVVAPDGASETRYEQGWRCLDCGHLEAV
jgi:uncharacterized protein with PIN domain